jgi:two-component system, LuxR family, sensor kinase FixL
LPRTHADHDLSLEALQTEHALLWDILDVVAALVIGFDRKGRIVLFNRACENATGYTFDELKGSCFWDRLLLPEEVDKVKKVFGELSTGSFQNEHTNFWVAKDNQRLRIHWKNTAVFGADGSVRYVIGTGTDITEREYMEQVLREREAELRKLSFAMEQCPNTIIITDAEGRIEYVNPAFTKQSGYTFAEVRGKNPRFLKSGGTSDAEYEKLWRAITTGGEWRGVFHNRKKDGELYWEAAYVGPLRDVEGRVTHFLAIQENITEYRRLQERFRRVFESAPNGMVMTDENGRIVLTNRQMEILFGYGRDELIGQPIELLVPKRLRDPHCAHRKRFRGERRPRMMGVGRELHGRRKDGSEFPVEIGLSPLETEERLVLAAVVDVTARKEAENEAKRRLEELAHVSRVASIGEMASGLAHEINQPLTAIVSYADACRLMLESGREQKQVLLSSLEEISRQGERAGDIIHRLREFVTRGKLERRPVSVNDLVQDVLDMLGHELQSHDVDVRLHLAQSLPLVEADKVQIEQVIFNLVRNAIEAMEGSESGNRRLTIGTGNMQVDGPGIEMFVRDTGKGLSPEASERLFDAFYSTKQKGMGLGLSITRTIVNAHGGRIWASAGKDGGTIFRVVLPLSNATR